MQDCLSCGRPVYRCHENLELAVPFLEVYKALEDFDGGVEPELLAKDSSLKKRPRSSRKAHLKLMASACLEVLVQQGEEPEAAAARGARHVSRWPGIGSQLTTATIVQNWRDQHRALDSARRKQFDLLCAPLLGRADLKSEVV